MSDSSRNAPARDDFGGAWTEKKLAVVEKYLSFYVTALKHQLFQLTYIDAFAGSGSWRPRQDATSLLFDSEDDSLAASLREGSARRALRIDPPFQRYVFVERRLDKLSHLSELSKEFPELTGRLEFHHGDANVELRALAAESWSKRRGVAFVDPFSTEVEWATIEALAQTAVLDVWLLIPFGAINRMIGAAISGQAASDMCLTRVLGTATWKDQLVRTRVDRGLFEPMTEQSKVDAYQVAAFVQQRLKETFPAVADAPGVLRNSRKSPLFLLCFAVANPEKRAQELAMKAANHLLKELP